MGQKNDYPPIGKKTNYALIRKYNSFLFESDEKTHPLIISAKLAKALNNLNSDIAKRILLDYQKGVHHDITYLDYVADDKEQADKITYLPSDRFLKTPDMIDVYESRLRQPMSIGKIVNKLFPNVFGPIQVELFVNEYKGELAKQFSDFYLAEGDEIRHWYHEKHYSDRSKGTLNGSCMKGDKAQEFFDIYCKNPQKVKLLILFSNKAKTEIKGRALIWIGLRKPVEIVGTERRETKIYMDRVYTVADSDIKLYTDYAISKNWLYKARQVMNDASYIENGQLKRESVAITLNKGAYKYYPSLDTLSYYTPSTGRLASYAGNGVPGHPRYILNNTGGKASPIDR